MGLPPRRLYGALRRLLRPIPLLAFHVRQNQNQPIAAPQLQDNFAENLEMMGDVHPGPHHEIHPQNLAPAADFAQPDNLAGNFQQLEFVRSGRRMPLFHPIGYRQAGEMAMGQQPVAVDPMVALAPLVAPQQPLAGHRRLAAAALVAPRHVLAVNPRIAGAPVALPQQPVMVNHRIAGAALPLPQQPLAVNPQFAGAHLPMPQQPAAVNAGIAAAPLPPAFPPRGLAAGVRFANDIWQPAGFAVGRLPFLAPQFLRRAANHVYRPVPYHHPPIGVYVSSLGVWYYM